MNTTVIGYRVFAMMRAKKLVKEDLRANGVKPSSISAAEMNTMVRLYLELHPELVREAKETVDKLTLEGAFGKRAQRELQARRGCA